MRLRTRAAISMADQAIISGSNFVIGLIVARLLGLDIFGVYSLMMVALFFWQTLQRAAITTPLISLYSQLPQDKRPHFLRVSSSLHWAMNAASIMSFAAFYLLGLAAGLGAQTFALFICYATVSLLHDYVRRVLYAQERYFTVTALDFMRYAPAVLYLLYAVFFATGGKSLETIFTVLTATTVLSLIVCLPVVPIHFVGRFWQSEYFGRYIEKGSRLSLSAIAQWVMGNIHLVLAGIFLGTAATGTIKAAQNLLSLANMIFQSVENFLIPRLSTAWTAKDLANFDGIFRTALRLIVAAVAVMAGALLPFSDTLYQLLFETVPQHGFAVLLLYAGAYVANAILLTNRCALIAMNRERDVLTAYFVGAVAIMVLSLVFVGVLGLIGLMIATVCSFTLSAFVSYWRMTTERAQQ